MRRIIAGLIFLCLLPMSVFCKPKYDLSKEKSFSTQVIEDLHSKKIIFIGENHDDVFPILLMTKYLQDFYDAGMRYIFLESGDDGYLSDTNLTEPSFEIVPPWCVYAWKYELRLMESEIERINNLHKSDPIKVI